MSQKNGTQAEQDNGKTNGIGSTTADPEVVPKARRRQHSVEYKLRILAEADACTERGQVGALLRREGLHSSMIEKWRKQRARGAMAGLTPQKRGPKVDPQAVENARLQREIERLQARLQQAETIIDVQKKLSTLLGLTLDESAQGGPP